MKDNQIETRELAVAAITHKNNLEAEVHREEHIIAELERKAADALQSGNRELARQFFKEKTLHEQVLQQIQACLPAAIESTDKMKAALTQAEERIRMRTAEAQALRVKRKQEQIQDRVQQALSQFPLTAPPLWEWSAACERAFEEWAASQSVATNPGASTETAAPDTAPPTDAP